MLGREQYSKYLQTDLNVSDVSRETLTESWLFE